MKSMVVNLGGKNINETVAYYQDTLGFVLLTAVDKNKEGFDTLNEDKDYLWAMMSNQAVSIMFQRVESLQEDIGDFFNTLGASLTLYIDVENVDEWYNTIKDKVTIYKDIYTTWYGQKEFYIQDINGYILGFASQAEA